MVIIQEQMPEKISVEQVNRETTIIERCRGREPGGQVWQWFRKTIVIAGLIMSQEDFSFEQVSEGTADAKQA